MRVNKVVKEVLRIETEALAPLNLFGGRESDGEGGVQFTRRPWGGRVEHRIFDLHGHLFGGVVMILPSIRKS